MAVSDESITSKTIIIAHNSTNDSISLFRYDIVVHNCLCWHSKRYRYTVEPPIKDTSE